MKKWLVRNFDYQEWNDVSLFVQYGFVQYIQMVFVNNVYVTLAIFYQDLQTFTFYLYLLVSSPVDPSIATWEYCLLNGL